MRRPRSGPLDGPRPPPGLEHMRRGAPAHPHGPLGPRDGHRRDQLLDAVLPDHPRAHPRRLGRRGDVELPELLGGQRARLPAGEAGDVGHDPRVSNTCPSRCHRRPGGTEAPAADLARRVGAPEAWARPPPTAGGRPMTDPPKGESPVLQTDHYIRFERVDSVEETQRGLLAGLHREQLRVDLVADDVVRVKISRGGVFDEAPTFAVCTDPLSRPVEFRGERDEDRVRVITSWMVVSLWLDPFRLDVHRADGTPVVETAADEQGRYWAYATLNDAFTVRRRCRQEDAIFGLGEQSGRHNRKGRDFTMWNTDVLSPTESAEFTAGKEPGDPRGDRTSVDFDPFYVSIPFFYHQSYPAGTMAASFVDNGYRGSYEFSAKDEYRISFAGGQYTEYIFAGPDMPAILRDYTWLTGRTAPPPLWALGYHQCRWFDYSQDAVEAIGKRQRDHANP